MICTKYTGIQYIQCICIYIFFAFIFCCAWLGGSGGDGWTSILLLQRYYGARQTCFALILEGQGPGFTVGGLFCSAPSSWCQNLFWQPGRGLLVAGSSAQHPSEKAASEPDALCRVWRPETPREVTCDTIGEKGQLHTPLVMRLHQPCWSILCHRQLTCLVWTVAMRTASLCF